MAKTQTSGLDTTEQEGFSPAIAVFHCRWCLPDSEKVRSFLPDEIGQKALLIRLNCSARMEAEFAIKALSEGYDGILVLGCETGECHFRTGNHTAMKRLALLRSLFSLSGINPKRLEKLWVSPFDEDAIVNQVSSYVDNVRDVGTFK